MRLITLNIWGGRVSKDLTEFLKYHSSSVDIFCFQEVYNGHERLPSSQGVITDMFTTMEKLLPNFVGFHAESGLFDVDFSSKVSYGIAMFVNKELEIRSQGVYEIFKPHELSMAGLQTWNRLLQYVAVPYKESVFTIFNLHGLYTGGGKGDVDARILQSERVRACMDKHPGEKILCGDFNLNPDTESLAILTDGMRDLVKEYNVPTTRSHYYTKPMRFADYMLVSSGVEVKHFEVLQNVISDHLPLVLEF